MGVTESGKELYISLRLHGEDYDVGDVWSGGSMSARRAVSTHHLIGRQQPVIGNQAGPV